VGFSGFFGADVVALPNDRHVSGRDLQKNDCMAAARAAAHIGEASRYGGDLGSDDLPSRSPTGDPGTASTPDVELKQRACS